MDWQKSVNLVAIGLVAWLLIIEWDRFGARESELASLVESQSVATAVSEIPVEPVQDISEDLPQMQFESAAIPQIKQTSGLVSVATDVLLVTIDTLGGDIVEVRLREHLTAMANDGGEPFTLLTSSKSHQYIAKSGLIGPDATDTAAGRPQFAVASNSYELLSGDQHLHVDLTLKQGDARIVKRFHFIPGDYTIGVEYQVNNLSDKTWEAAFYGQIKRDSNEPLIQSSGGMQPYLGAALRQKETNFAKYDFSDMEGKPLKETLEAGWVAMVQHYFVSAWIPPREDTNSYSLRKLKGQDVYLMGFVGEKFSVAAGSSGNYKAQFYVGPKDQDTLAELADYLDLTVDYGFLWMLAKPIFYAMQYIHTLLGNWGWSIILLTIFIKVLLYPLSAASLKSMAKMRNLQPEMARLKELYGDDRQKMSQELMGLYKKEKVNPAGGCLPMLLQMPVFISLYWVLLESVEIRHTPWIFWIQDLSAKDPFFVLPIIMGASMLLMQKMQPMPTDPMQAKVMKLMPIMFTVFFMFFPAGLVLYWTVNNLLSMLQQWVVNKQLATSKKS